MPYTNILVQWTPNNKIKTYGQNLHNGWWYIYLPFDRAWHHIEENKVTILDKS